MSVRFVRVAVFDHPLQAKLARNYLEAEGISAFVGNSEIAEMNWALTNAIGGIEVRVDETQAEKARTILNKLETTGSATLAQIERSEESDVDREDFEVSVEQDQDASQEEEELTEREENARRAMRAAVLGLIMFPLQLYATCLLLRVFGSSQHLGPRAKRLAILAAAINLPIIAAILVAFAAVLFLSWSADAR